MGSKLTLSMDEDLIRFAHELAREKNESISSIVAGYLSGLRKKRFDVSELHPDVQRMLGSYQGRDFPKTKQELRDQYHNAKLGL